MTTNMQATFDAYYAENWPLCKASIENGTASEEITDEREALWDTWQDAWKAALASRPDAQADEPIAYEFQHDETGRTTFVDPWQVEQGFAANNPRWQLIGPVFRHARAAAPSPDREKAASPSRECGERNQCDGCNVGAPLTERGNHAMPDGGFMGCTKDRYEASAPTLGEGAAPMVDRERWDDIAVDAFARAMKAKMAEARAKGRSGWEGCHPAVLSRMLRQHVEKGDPRDVANFCMMLWHHGAPIAPAVAQPGLTDEQIDAVIAQFMESFDSGTLDLRDFARALLSKGGE